MLLSRFCLNVEGRKFKSLEVREASSSHLKMGSLIWQQLFFFFIQFHHIFHRYFHLQEVVNILPRKNIQWQGFADAEDVLVIGGALGEGRTRGQQLTLLLFFAISQIFSLPIAAHWTDQAGFFPRERSRPTTFCYNSSWLVWQYMCTRWSEKSWLGSKKSMIFFSMKYTMIDRLFAMTFGKILNIHKTNETQP